MDDSRLLTKGTKTQYAKQNYDVEIYNGKHLLEIQTIKAKDPEEAGTIARNRFFENINAKIKRNWN